MMIKYCNKCTGHPYTEDFSASVCPVCNNVLLYEVVEPDTLANRPKLVMPVFEGMPLKNNVAPSNSMFPVKGDDNNGVALPADVSKGNVPVVVDNDDEPEAREGTTIITGKVSQYSSTGKEDGSYRRLLITKIIDAIFYRQRIEDVLHRFNVRVEEGKDLMGYSRYSDVPVNVHGTIAGGMQITDNSNVEVEGKYRNGVLMASRVSIVNNGYQSQIKFQRSITAIAYGILAAIAAIALVIFAANAGGDFFANLKGFFLTWMAFSVVTAILYFVLIFSKIGFLARMTSGKSKRFPIVGILLFSLVITMIFMNSFGLGTSLGGLFSSLLSAIMPTLIIIIAIIFLIKLIFK